MVTKYNVAQEATEYIYPAALLGFDFPEGPFTMVYAEKWHFKEQYFGASLFGNFYRFLRIFCIPPTFCLCLFLDTRKVVPLTISHPIVQENVNHSYRGVMQPGTTAVAVLCGYLAYPSN
ncbi:unnamed protein product [Ixodes pacificus]